MNPTLLAATGSAVIFAALALGAAYVVFCTGLSAGYVLRGKVA